MSSYKSYNLFKRSYLAHPNNQHYTWPKSHDLFAHPPLVQDNLIVGAERAENRAER